MAKSLDKVIKLRGMVASGELSVAHTKISGLD